MSASQKVDISLDQNRLFHFWTKLPCNTGELPLKSFNRYMNNRCSKSPFDMAAAIIRESDLEAVDWSLVRNGVIFGFRKSRLNKSGNSSNLLYVVYVLPAGVVMTEAASPMYCHGWQLTVNYGLIDYTIARGEKLRHVYENSREVNKSGHFRHVVLDGNIITRTPCETCPNIVGRLAHQCDWMSYACIDGKQRFAERLNDPNDSIHTPDLDALFGAGVFVSPSRAIHRRPFQRYNFSGLLDKPKDGNEITTDNNAVVAAGTKRVKRVLCANCIYGGRTSTGAPAHCAINKYPRYCTSVIFPNDVDAMLEQVDVRVVDTLLSDFSVSADVFRKTFSTSGWYARRRLPLTVKGA